MNYISTFSGIEAASVAWKGLDFEPVAFSEILPFQSELLKQRYPSVPNLGDITEVDWSEYRDRVDLVVGGSPCQSFSVASAFHDESQRGLKGKSGLMFEYIRCVKEVNPKYFLWENVPPALSSENGRAFATLLTSCQEFGYSMCWRILDATNFGSAQTRKRVFLLGAKNSQIPPLVMLDKKNCFGEKEEFKCDNPKAWGIRGSQVNRNDKWMNELHAYVTRERIGTILAGFAPHVIVSKNGASRVSKTEMERLFGFPVGYVQDIEFNGRKPNYKQVQQALGNSFCIGPVRYIGQRLEKVDKLLA